MQERIHIEIEGMTCGKCTARVENALCELELPISAFEVTLEPGGAWIELDEHVDGAEARLVDAIEDSGYDARVGDAVEAPIARDVEQNSAEIVPDIVAPDALRFDVEGMTCASCVARVQKAIEAVDGVSRVAVNFATEVASVELSPTADPRLISDVVQSAVEASGYQAIRQDHVASTAARPERMSDRRAIEANTWKSRWVWGVALTIPIVLAQMGPGWFGWELNRGGQLLRLAMLLYLTTAVMAFVGRPYLQGAIQGLKHATANMDTLVALGSSVAWAYSTIQVVRVFAGYSAAAEVYFDGAAMIVTLISVGKWLESRAKGEAGRALEALLDLGAREATVKRDGRWVTLGVDALVRDDIVRVAAGEKVPIDGVITEGHAHVDESMISGESVPVSRGAGDRVVGATVNTDGQLILRVTAVGEDTALAQIVRQVEKAQESKADIQRLADRVSAIFVPVVLVVAVVTFIAWFVATGSVAAAVLPAVSVLIVACPCALGLATPTAIMVGTSVAAQSGIVIRDAQALERARQLDALIFDKTGTLTRGMMQVGHSDYDDEVLSAVAALESRSLHPIARALVHYISDTLATDEWPAVEHFQDLAGQGVSGSVDSAATRVGKVEWLKDELAEGRLAQANAWMASGFTVVAALSGDHQGIFALRDEPKPDAAETVSALEARGVPVWMITGDNPATAASIAAEVGITESRVRAGVLPGDKADAVREIQRTGGVVAMVGDGLNDAPALVQADLGIAMATGTDLAIEAADITLVSTRLTAVVDAVDAAQRTYAKIRQNLFWAFAYNTVLIPVAAAGLLHPAMAAGAMALSSVSVVSNSLLLKRAR